MHVIALSEREVLKISSLVGEERSNETDKYQSAR